MASLADIHGALAGRLSTIDGLRAFPHPPQAATPPVAYVHLVEWATQSFGRSGPRTLTFEVVVLTSESVRPQDGYQRLVEFADESVRNALWDGNANGVYTGTYNGTTYTCTKTQVVVVPGFRVLGAQEMDELQMYGGAFTVSVTTSN